MINRKQLLSIISGFGLLGVIATAHQNLEYFNREITYPAFAPYVDSSIARYLVRHPQGAELQALGLINDVTTMFTLEKEAMLRILRSSHLMNWHHMHDTTVHGYGLKYQDGVFYTLDKGIVFEATYKRSHRKFYFTDPYGIETEVNK